MTPAERLLHVREAIRNLEIARNHLHYAQAPRSLARVRAALKSAEGAFRNALHRVDRENDSGRAATLPGPR